MNHSTPGLLVHHQLRSSLRLTSIESVMPSSHLILCHPLLLLPQSLPASGGRTRAAGCGPRRLWWAEGQGSSPTPHFKSINSSALSFLYSPTLTSIHDYWKNHSLTRRTFVGKVMSLLLNMLSRLVITFLPRSKRLLILWLQSPSTVILEPPKIKSASQKSPDTPGSLEGNTEGPGTASSEPLLPS